MDTIIVGRMRCWNAASSPCPMDMPLSEEGREWVSSRGLSANGPGGGSRPQADAPSSPPQDSIVVIGTNCIETLPSPLKSFLIVLAAAPQASGFPLPKSQYGQ